MTNSTNGQPARTPILILYRDGSMERADMTSGDLRNIGRQLIAMADNMMLPGTMPVVAPEMVVESENDTA